MTADCPVCGLGVALADRRTLAGSIVMGLLPHSPAGVPTDDSLIPRCWGALPNFSLEDILAAVDTREELGDRLRLAAHP